MRSRYYYIRRLLNVVDDDGGGGGDDDTPRNTGSSRVSPLPSSSTVENPQFKPTLGFDSSMALTILILLAALFFMVFFSMYLRRFADDNSFNTSRRRRRPSSSSAAAAAAAGAVDADVTARFDASSSFSSSNGLDPSTIRSLPLYSYDGNGNTTEPILCSVCLSEFEEKETTKVIPYCGHAFHPQCIDKWFYSHSSCPLCRSTQLFREGSSGSGSVVKKEKETEMMKKKKKDCLVVEVNVRSSQKRFCLEHNNNHRIVIHECESLGKSTVESGDTSLGVVDDKERKETTSGGLRRISSWSGLDEKVVLKRSLSF